MIDKKLYVISVISNPRRFRSRYKLYEDFAKYVSCSGAHLLTVEMSFGDRPFAVTDPDHHTHICVNSLTELWSKENMINIGISNLPSDWEYVAWVDADITFARPDWVQETLHMLQHHHVVQMFSVAQDLSPSFEPFNRFTGFVKKYWDSGFTSNENPAKADYYSLNGHPGYAWAATREAIDILGGLYDAAILGAGDRHMAYGLLGAVDQSIPVGVTAAYRSHLRHWEKRAKRLNKDIGFVEGLVNHQWHGKKKDRRYHDRWKVLVDHKFDPYTDIYKDSQGLWRLHEDEKPGLRDDIRRYFLSRNEDSCDME